MLEAAYAVLALRRADLHTAAAVHIRKALEFAVVAQWIHVTPKGLDAFIDESRHNVDKLVAEAITANVLVPAQVAASLARDAAVAPDQAKVMSQFKRVADSFGVGSGIYMMYRSLSSQCHPNVGAVVQHLEEAPESTGGVAICLHGGVPNSAHYFTLAASLLWVARPVDSRTKFQPRKADLQSISKRLGVPSQLKPLQ